MSIYICGPRRTKDCVGTAKPKVLLCSKPLVFVFTEDFKFEFWFLYRRCNFYFEKNQRIDVEDGGRSLMFSTVVVIG